MFNKKNKTTSVPDDEHEDIQARTDRDGYKTAVAVSVFSIVGAIAMFAYFLMSDVTDNIVAARAGPAEVPIVHNNDESAVGGSDESRFSGDFYQGDQYVIAALPGVAGSVDQDELVRVLDDMDAETFDAFMTSIMDATQDGDATQDTPEGVPSGDSDTGSDEETTAADAEDGLTIESAIEDAEAAHPELIDGSQRLQLIEELNAVDFKYYIAEAGDTLIDIGEAFDVPLGQLVEINGIHDADVLGEGTLIFLPSETVLPDGGRLINE